MAGLPVRRALLSVHDKTGLVEFARALATRGVEILSTGGTARALREAGIAVRDVSEETGFPEMMDGRVKTLHPKIHGALLGLREDAGHVDAMQRHGIRPIDLVVVSLYPFESTVAREGVSFEEAVEQIDIGGPAMIRSAAKNHRSVGVVTDRSQYGDVLRSLASNEGGLSDELLAALARAAYARTAAYDATIASWLAKRQDESLPESFGASRRVTRLRYGENPHQEAALYADPTAPEGSLVRARVLGGKEISFNNYGDADAAWSLVREFEEPACVVVKHANPCGVAVRDDLALAYEAAVACDPRSSFGGIVALNRPLPLDLARRMAVPERFLEVLVAPEIGEAAAAAFSAPSAPRWGPNLRLLDAGRADGEPHGLDVRTVDGGFLVQERDRLVLAEAGPKTVTRRHPTDEEARDLWFAFTVAKHVKSNAIVFAKGRRAIGVGAGQMSRVEATEIALSRGRRWASETGESLEGGVVASDAFYPFNDALVAAIDAGARAVVQPGGSRNDEAAIALCDERGVAMWFTGVRHFRH